MARKAKAEAGVDDDDPVDGAVWAPRFRALVKAVGGPKRASAILEKSPNTIHGYMTGRSRIPFVVVFKLAQAADLTLDQFAAGEEAISPSRMAPMHMVQSQGGGAPEGYVTVPTIDVRASAGAGAITLSAEPAESDIVAFRESWLRTIGLIPGRVHILWAKGDSMLPTIRDGDMLLVDRTIDSVTDNGIYIVVVAGAVVVKRLTIRTNGSVVLRSDNDRYPEEIIPPDEVTRLIVEGRVRWVGGPI